MKISRCYKETKNTKIRLCADITDYGYPDKTFFFEFDKDYEDYLCTDYADPFALMLLEYCMATKQDLYCEQPMTDELYFNLTKFFIPILSDNTKTFNKIDIHTDAVEDSTSRRNGVATGLSGGVDSLHTIWQYKDYEIEKYRLTHLLFANIGSMGYGTQEETESFFNLEVVKMQAIADEVGLPLISVNTSMMDFYHKIKDHRANNNEGLKISGVVYALRSLFRTYYIASTVGIDNFKFSDSDVGYFAPFTANIISTRGTRFYIGDLDTSTRMGKVEHISDWSVPQRHLTMQPNGNCGKCSKCIRTQMELKAIGKLDGFSSVFDIEKFKREWAFLWAKNISEHKEWEFGYNNETINKFRENHKWLPIRCWIYAVFFWIPAKSIKKWIKKIKSS